MSRTAKNMKKLIERKYYATGEQALNILDAFLMAGRITMEEYTELCLLVEATYNPAPEVPAVEPPQDPAPETTPEQTVSDNQG